MGHVFTEKDLLLYESWVSDPAVSSFLKSGTGFMKEMLKPVKRCSVLDIGCGLGISSLALVEAGLDVTGIDPSDQMIKEAQKRLGKRVCLHRGFAEDLPFEDNSFNYCVFFISLEFVDDPVLAVGEACRVAKDKVFIGFINRYSLQAAIYTFKKSPFYKNARFYSAWELCSFFKILAGDIPLEWRTSCHIPFSLNKNFGKADVFKIFKRSPFGFLGGITACLVPLFRTTPVEIKGFSPKKTPSVAGSVPVGTTANFKAKKGF